MSLLSTLWAWLSDSKNQKTLSFIGGGLIASATLAWQVFVYFENRQGNGELQDGQAALLAPVPLEPQCDSVIPWPGDHIFLMFNWRPVAGASSYTVEVDCFGCGEEGKWYSTGGTPWHMRSGLGFRTQDSPIYSSNVHVDWRAAGGTGLRWRVWAADEGDRNGAKSPWCPFNFYGNLR